MITRTAKLRKADIASKAERLVEGTGWMPAMFKAEDSNNGTQVEGEAEGLLDDGDENVERAESIQQAAWPARAKHASAGHAAYLMLRRCASGCRDFRSRWCQENARIIAMALSEGCQQRFVSRFFKCRSRINQPLIEERPLAAAPGVGMVIQRHVDSPTKKRCHVDPWQGFAVDAGFFLDNSLARFFDYGMAALMKFQ